MAARPLVKKGEANISSGAEQDREPGARLVNREDEAEAMTARTRSLAIMMRLRSKRSRKTPATGPASTAGMARDRHDAGDHHPGAGLFHHQREDRDVVEVVADLADHLPIHVLR